MIELLAVIATIAILVALLIGNYERIVSSAQQAICASRMRSIHTALNLYLQDNKDVWPQAPEIKHEKQWEAFWLSTLEPFGISRKTWQCPTIKSLVRRSGDEATKVHYAPSTFTDTPGIARRWSTQPWLIERADVHGQGPLIAFPDGSIKPMRRVLYEQGMIR